MALKMSTHTHTKEKKDKQIHLLLLMFSQPKTQTVLVIITPKMFNQLLVYILDTDQLHYPQNIIYVTNKAHQLKLKI